MSENLIEPEGVNSTTTNTKGDGGNPAAAPDSAMQVDEDNGDEMVGTTEESENGQDEGN